MPDARCTRGLVCEVVRESCTRAYRAAENIRHSLRNGFTAYDALTPGYRAFLPPSPHGNWNVGPVGPSAPPRDLAPTIEASGPHDFAVRSSIIRPHAVRSLTELIPPCNHAHTRCRRVHHNPSQRSVTMANAPSKGTGWRES
jgi:hypothetical protein